MKVWLIVAGILVLAGLLLFAGVMSVNGWDFSKISTSRYVENTYEIRGDFEGFNINETTADIEFVLSNDGKGKVVCVESEKMKHTVGTENMILNIDIVDSRAWYDYIGINYGSPKTTVYLPEKSYKDLCIDVDTGYVVIPDDFVFDNIDVNGSTGAVNCMATVLNKIDIELDTGSFKGEKIVAEQVNVSTDTGKVVLSEVTVKDSINIDVDTGKVELTDVKCGALEAQSDTGKIILKNVVSETALSLQTSTGDVIFEKSDAEQITVKTSTGSVSGSLLSDKIFDTKTSTGKIRVPQSKGSQMCKITTSTGNIDIRIEQ